MRIKLQTIKVVVSMAYGLAGILGLGLAVGCTPNDSVEKVAAVTLDQQGGQVKTSDQVLTLTVPAGALDKATTIEITKSTQTPQGYATLTPVYSFKPEGLRFASPVKVKFSYDTTRLPVGVQEDQARVIWTDEQGQFQAMKSNVDTADHTVEAEVSHFSRGFAGFHYQAVCCRRPEGYLDNHLPRQECLNMHGKVLKLSLDKCKTVCCLHDGKTESLDFLVCEQNKGQESCAGRHLECGDDGCGGSCGSCPTGKHCNSGKCVSSTARNVKWTFKADEGFGLASPVVGKDGTIYAATNKHLYALAPDGSLKWKVDVPVMYSAPAIDASGTVYIGGADNNLYAINQGGQVKWKLDLSQGLNSDGYLSVPAIGKKGTVYIGSAYAFLAAVNQDGTIKWKVTTDNVEAYRLSPAIGQDGTIYIASDRLGKYSVPDEIYLHAMASDITGPEGKEKWKFQIKALTDSSPCVASDGTIYIGDKHGDLYAVKPDGTLKWQYNAPSSGFDAPPAIDFDGTIYALATDSDGLGHLYALDPSSGALKWDYKVKGQAEDTPVIGPGASGSTVYFTDMRGNVYAINHDGTEAWVFALGGNTRLSPALSKDAKALYVATVDGHLYAIELDAAAQAQAPWPLWRHDAKNTGQFTDASGKAPW